MAVIASEAFEWLDAPPQRLTTPDTPIPYNLSMMNAVLPGVEKIRKKMNWLLAY